MKPLIKRLLSSNNEELPELASYVEVRRSERAKRLALRLDTKKRVFVLVVPKRISMRRAHEFAIEHEEWMEEKLAELPAPIKLGHGLELPIFGQMRRIEVDFNPDAKRTDVSLADKILHVRTNKDDPSPRIIRFLKAQAKEQLSALSHEKAAQIDKSVASVSVRDTKSRWGSCSADGNLSYSWRLIFAPYESFDYVVAHEVAHLEHLDHSENFWALCRELSDDYVEGHYWMRNHGYELMRYC